MMRWPRSTHRRALVTLSLAGSLYVVAGLARRLTTVGLRWSAGRPRRRLLVPRPAWRA